MSLNLDLAMSLPMDQEGRYTAGVGAITRHIAAEIVDDQLRAIWIQGVEHIGALGPYRLR
jgi:hypothetical protein